MKRLRRLPVRGSRLRLYTLPMQSLYSSVTCMLSDGLVVVHSLLSSVWVSKTAAAGHMLLSDRRHFRV